MSGNKNYIDKLIQQKLDGHKVNAPENAWGRLRGELHSPSRTRFFWITRSAAAAILLLIAFGAGYFFSEMNRDGDSQLAGTSEPALEQDLDNKDAGFQLDKETLVDKGQPDEHIQETFGEQPLASGKPSEALIADNIQNADSDATEEKQLTAAESEKIIEPSQEIPQAESEREGMIPIEATGAQETLAQQQQEIIPDINQSIEDELQTDVPVMTDEMLREMLIADDDLAQDMLLKNEESGKSKWSIGAVLSPVYSYRTVSGDAFTGTDEAVDAGFFNDNEEGITSIAGGISLDFNFNNRLSLGSGMYFSRIGQQNNDVLAYNDPDMPDLYKLATSTGTITVNPRSFENVIVEQEAASPKDSIPGDYIVNSSLVQNLDYLEVPLVLKYKVIESRFSVNVMGGLSPGILVNNRSYFTLEGQKMQTGTTENINNFIYNSILGLGLEYAISRKVAISMQPSFKYSLTPVNSGTGLEYHPYSLSWFTGISYTLD